MAQLGAILLEKAFDRLLDAAIDDVLEDINGPKDDPVDLLHATQQKLDEISNKLDNLETQITQLTTHFDRKVFSLEQQFIADEVSWIEGRYKSYLLALKALTEPGNKARARDSVNEAGKALAQEIHDKVTRIQSALIDRDGQAGLLTKYDDELRSSERGNIITHFTNLSIFFQRYVAVQTKALFLMRALYHDQNVPFSHGLRLAEDVQKSLEEQFVFLQNKIVGSDEWYLVTRVLRNPAYDISCTLRFGGFQVGALGSFWFGAYKDDDVGERDLVLESVNLRSISDKVDVNRDYTFHIRFKKRGTYISAYPSQGLTAVRQVTTKEWGRWRIRPGPTRTSGLRLQWAASTEETMVHDGKLACQNTYLHPNFPVGSIGDDTYLGVDKAVFLNPEGTWTDGYSQVHINTDSSYFNGPQRTFELKDYEGKRLRGSNNVSAIWLVVEGKLRLIANMGVYTNLFGDYRESLLSPQAVIDEADKGATLSANPALIKSPDNTAVYLVDGGKKRHIASGDVFNRYEFDWSKIALVDTGKFEDGTPIY